MKTTASGILVLDKPAGPTSFQVVRTLRRLLRPKRIGHLGTLDPFATGVLPLVINEATKLVPFLMDSDKSYRATICLGARTDTQDVTGRIIDRRERLPGKAEIEAVLPTFLGEQWQTPPLYAAIHYQGQRLYQLARQGLAVEPPPRRIIIKELQLEAIQLPLVTIVLTCSKGTYVRALAAAIGERLGCGAYLQALRRLRVGPFTLEQALPLPTACTPALAAAYRDRLIPLAECLPQLPGWRVAAEVIPRLRQGQPLKAGQELPPDFPGRVGERWRLLADGELLAVAEVQLQEGQLRLQPVRVFHPREVPGTTQDYKSVEDSCGINEREEE